MNICNLWKGHVANSIRHLVLDDKLDEAMWFLESLPENQQDFAYSSLVIGLDRFAIRQKNEKRKKAKGRKVHRAAYSRAGTLDVDFVLQNVGSQVKTKFGVLGNCASWRIQAYAVNGVTCVVCGLVGNMVAIEKNRIQKTKKHHLNLYHVNESGEETMITIDHIIPKSKGGGNEISNLQTMCCHCNTAKGNTIPSETEIKEV